MMFRPAILALVGVSLASVILVVLSAAFALRVVRHWDIASGSERQLRLERRTYLISTFLTFVFAAQIVALLLFIYNAESMSSQFVGAMCATGVLNINGYGWPVLLLKITLFFLGALWLTLHRLDNQGYDYPLIRVKYAILLLIVPVALAEFATQLAYFLDMDPNVITSCCGSLFSPESDGVAADIAGLPPLPTLFALFAAALFVAVTGGRFLVRGRGAPLYAAASLVSLVIALAAVISVIGLYVYEHPHHHCPFCLLKSGHDYIGYFLYLPLFAAAALGLSAGAIAPFANIMSITDAVRRESGHFVRLSLIFWAVFFAVAAFAVARSHLTLLAS